MNKQALIAVPILCTVLLASCATNKDVVMAGFAYDERAQFAEAHSYLWLAELNDDGDRTSNLQVARTMFERLGEGQHAGTESALLLAVLESHLVIAEASVAAAPYPATRLSAIAARAKALETRSPQTLLLEALALGPDKALDSLENLRKSESLEIEGSLRLVALFHDKGRLQDALLLLDSLVPSIDQRLGDAFSKTRAAMIAGIESGVRNAVEAKFAGLSETKKQDLLTLLAQQPWAQVLNSKKTEDLLIADGDPLLLRRNLAWFCTQLLLSYPRQDRLRKDWQIWLDGANLRSKSKPRPSSVGDISQDDEYWFAVARVVERAIMNLPDGKNFEGLRAASGVEVLQALRALNGLAPKASDPTSEL